MRLFSTPTRRSLYTTLDGRDVSTAKLSQRAWATMIVMLITLWQIYAELSDDQVDFLGI